MSTPRVHFGASLSTAWQRPAAAPAGAGAVTSFAQLGWGAPSMQRQQDRSLQTLGGATMGTTWSLRLVNPGFAPLAPVQALVQDTLDAVIGQMSNWEADSALSLFNCAPAGSWHTLPPELTQVLDAALHWARACDGAWDPTVGALVALWGFGPRPDPLAPHAGTPPSAAAIAQALAVCGHQRLQWDLAEHSAERRLWQPGGLQLDLSGIAKGFAVDWVAERLQQAGWSHALLEIGGELRAWGRRPDGSPWRVAVAGRATGQGGAADPLVLSLKDGALATSGDHWHGFEHQGRRYSHTLDPRTGWPVPPTLTSVTVWHGQCLHADALATVLTVLGPETGWDFALQQQIAAVFTEHPEVGVQGAAPLGRQRCTPAWTALTS